MNSNMEHRHKRNQIFHGLLKELKNDQMNHQIQVKIWGKDTCNLWKVVKCKKKKNHKAFGLLHKKLNQMINSKDKEICLRKVSKIDSKMRRTTTKLKAIFMITKGKNSHNNRTLHGPLMNRGRMLYIMLHLRKEIQAKINLLSKFLTIIKSKDRKLVQAHLLQSSTLETHQEASLKYRSSEYTNKCNQFLDLKIWI